jgi:hypothetical protein
MATTPSLTTQPEDRNGTRPSPPEAPSPPGAIEAAGSGPGGPPESTELPSDFWLVHAGNRDRALPVRQDDLTRMLLSEPGLSETDRRLLQAIGEILGATFHSEFFGRLRQLKDLYAPLDPDSEYISLGRHTHHRSEHSDEEFLTPFEATLNEANYRLLDLDVIKEAISAPNEMGLTYTPDFSLFEHLRVYVRGFTRITRDIRSFRTRFRKRTVALDAYQRLVVALKFKPGTKLGPFVRSDVLYLRMFKDVPHVDMEMHLPEQGTRVRMRWIDKAQVASPVVLGIPTILAKILDPAILAKLLALGLPGPGALIGLIAAPITMAVNSLFGFQRNKQKHLYAMIHRLYYMSLANNASVLTRLIDSAEDEEYKEAMLAYYFLWRGPGRDRAGPSAWTVPTLDSAIEQYLRERTGVEINFEVSDALNKLFRMGLAAVDAQGRLRATPLQQALEVLDRHWDDTFKYVNLDRHGLRASALERC